MGCSIRFVAFPGRAKDRPIESLDGQQCSARGKSQRKTRWVDTAERINHVKPVAMRSTCAMSL